MQSLMVALSEKAIRRPGEVSMTLAMRARLLSLGMLVCAQAIAAPAGTPIYKNPNAAIEARVDDLLSRMSLEEKVAQMQSVWDNKGALFDAKLELDPKKMLQKFPDG